MCVCELWFRRKYIKAKQFKYNKIDILNQNIFKLAFIPPVYYNNKDKMKLLKGNHIKLPDVSVSYSFKMKNINYNEIAQGHFFFILITWSKVWKKQNKTPVYPKYYYFLNKRVSIIPWKKKAMLKEKKSALESFLQLYCTAN